MAIDKGKIQSVLTRGVEQIIVREHLLEKLQSGHPLRIKLGIDPTGVQLHLGHTVVLRKLKQFQDLGHTIIFLVGDFTARIGDPSDKLAARQPLTDVQIKENMKTYTAQVGKILDLQKAEIRHNAEWHAGMDFTELFQIMSRFTVNQMIDRDMFRQRLEKEKPLWVHELMYPILQGYDSVALRADVELGGTDQTFNMLAARTLQPHYNQEPQDILTVPLIEGTDGTHKMSKSVGNTINLTDAPADMFGKIMSIPDPLIIKYFQLLTDVPEKELQQYQAAMADGNNPRDYKERLATTIVTMYHSASDATAARDEFKNIFSGKSEPDSIDEVRGAAMTAAAAVSTLFGVSKSEARRLIKQGAVTANKAFLTDPDAPAPAGVYKKGRRHFKKLVIVKEK